MYLGYLYSRRELCRLNMMKLAIVLSVLLVQAFAMTTKHHGHHHTGHHMHTGQHGHHTGPTREPVEHESFGFKYDPQSMMLAAMVNQKCYLLALAGDERTAIHTAHGLHALELKMITAIDDTTMTYTMMSQADLMAASKMLAHTCHRAKNIMKLN